MNLTDTHISEAREMGRAAGLAAASWAADGNTSADHARRVLAMLDDGDPAADDYLPAYPNLSGEWADDLTPNSLARDILGGDLDDDYPEASQALCDAWEDGVAETFDPECERTLRAILPDEECES